MKYRNNGGCSAEELREGYEVLDGHILNSGESISGRTSDEYPGVYPGDDGFLTRVMPGRWQRPYRTDREDRG